MDAVIKIISTSFLVITVSLALSIIYFSSNQKSFATNDDLWYPGKVVKQDTYFRYKINDSSINNGTPFEMIIYFNDHNVANKTWTATVITLYDNQVVNETFYLDDFDLRIANNTVPLYEMEPSKRGYSSDVDWVSLLVNKWSQPEGNHLSPPLLCTTPGLGVIELFNNNGTEIVTVPAGTFNCTKLVVMEGAIGFIGDTLWINKDLPYPVKQHFDTYNPIKKSYPNAIELEEIGHGHPKIPEFPASVPIIVAIAFVIGILLFNVRHVSKFYFR
jgi:hypothetical protein